MRTPRQLAFAVAVAIALGSAWSPGAATAQHAARPRIAFFAPNSEANTYWPQVFGILEDVADDLDFELVPYSLGVEDRFARQEKTLQILSREPRPDAAIVSVVIGHSRRILDAASALELPVFILGPLFPSELPELGEAPRKKYASWVALFNWGEEEKGYALGKVLLREAERAHAFARDGSIHVVGVGGDPSWFGSGLRQAGLERAVAEHPRAVLKQVVPTKWSPAEARVLTTKLLKRFPEARVVWAASDQLGAGAVEALVELGLPPGKAAFTGGLDLSDVGLELVQRGQFSATVAGSMFSYARAAVMVYDYLNGLDFADQLDTVLEFPTHVATRENVQEHLRLSHCSKSIDWSRFSRVHNPSLKRYRFSHEAYLEAAAACVRE